MSTLTPEEMLYDMQAHARSSVVHIEPKTVALWHELVGQLMCGAAFDVGLALVETDDAARADEREACAKLCDEADAGYRAQADSEHPASTGAEAYERQRLRDQGNAAFHLAAAIRARGRR